MKKLIVCLVLSTMIGCAPSEDGVNYATIYSPSGDIIDEGFVNKYLNGYTSVDVELESGNKYFVALQNVIFDRRQGTVFSIYKEGEHDR